MNHGEMLSSEWVQIYISRVCARNGIAASNENLAEVMWRAVIANNKPLVLAIEDAVHQVKNINADIQVSFTVH